MYKQNDFSALAEHDIVKIICGDKRINKSTTFQILSNVYYELDKDLLLHSSLKKLWSSGAVMKRYLEYPCKGEEDIYEAFREIEYYLKRNDYIVNFISTKSENEEFNFIQKISIDNQQITFLSWQERGVMRERMLLFQDYYKEFLVLDGECNTVRFDIYQPMVICKQKGLCKDSLLEHFTNNIIVKSQLIRCVFTASNRSEAFTYMMREWFLSIEKIIEELNRIGWMGTNILSIYDRKLFGEDARNGYRYRYKVLSEYNRIIRNIVHDIQERDLEENFKDL